MRIFSTLIFILSGMMLSAQSSHQFWTEVSPSEVTLAETAEVELLPANHRVYALQLGELYSYLKSAPMEYTSAANSNPLKISLPMPDGGFEDYEIIQTQTMEPALAAKFPDIKSYLGRSVNNYAVRLRLNIAPQGVNLRIFNGEKTVSLIPYAQGQSTYHAAFYYKAFLEEHPQPDFICGTQHTVENDPSLQMNTNLSLGFRDGEDVILDTYQMAMSCTGEWANTKGGTVASVLNAFNGVVNFLNEYFGNDLGARFILVDGIEQMIYLDPETDPYQFLDPSVPLNPNNQYFLNQDKNEALLNQTIGEDNYDVSQLFSNGGCYSLDQDPNTGQTIAVFNGGEAGGRACGEGKGRGLTCNNGSIANIANTLAHEIAHAFSAGHTWNNCPGPLENAWASFSAIEPGSGSTIMSYSGGCGSQNVPTFGIDYYSAMSIAQVTNYIESDFGSCSDETETGNVSPVPSHNYENGFYIPISTPFYLEGAATDENEADVLTYCWEQYNTGPYSPLGSPQLNSPLFRSYPPVEEGFRYFPRLQTIVENAQDLREQLPDYGRDMTFRMTVRDNNLNTGGTGYVEVDFDATETAGPFLVMYPNESALTFKGGEYVEITWDVANTDNSLVDCQTVNVIMSNDGGYTYPYTLLNSTPNDGTAFVFMPDITTTSARVMVQAANNIFFDISNNNFSITPADEPGFAIIPSIEFEQICLPDVATVDFVTASILGYDDLVTIEVIDGLPDGIVANFSQNPIVPGESTTMSLDFTGLDIDQDGVYEIKIQYSAPGVEPIIQTLTLDLVYNDFSNFALMSPVNGTTGAGLLPTLEWTDVANADIYDIQISTSPTFEASTIVDEEVDINLNSYSPSVGLLEETIYFWRVRPSNQCGRAEYTEPFAFSTFFSTCDEFQSSDIPVTISAIGLPTITSTLTVVEEGIIQDLNLVNLKGNHDAVLDLEVSLTGPDQTTQVLFSNICGNTTQFNMNLDDEGAFDVGTNCPPVNSITYIPANPLSIFDGKSTMGDWKLSVSVIDDFGNGGELTNWGLEFCASFEPNAPFIVNNEQGEVEPLGELKIKKGLLLADDIDNNADELTFKVTKNTEFGTLYLDGVPLQIGQTYSQTAINSERLTYQNESGDIGTIDDYSFLVEDGTGGWTGIAKFYILITDDPISTVTAEEIDNSVILFPNPTADILNVRFKKAINEKVTLSIYDIHGRLLSQNVEQLGLGNVILRTDELADGFYLLAIQAEDAIFTKKFTVQR